MARSIVRKSTQIATGNEVLVPMACHNSLLVKLELVHMQSSYRLWSDKDALQTRAVESPGGDTGKIYYNEMATPCR